MAGKEKTHTYPKVRFSPKWTQSCWNGLHVSVRTTHHPTSSAVTGSTATARITHGARNAHCQSSTVKRT